MNDRPWWKGERGEWYVVLQAVLFVLVALGPRTWPGLPAWPHLLLWPSRIMGALLLAAGLLLVVAGITNLGRNLTAVPRPRDGGSLVRTGPFALVRHPMYGGTILAAFGWALWGQGWLTLGFAGLLFLFFDVKSRREERWLCQSYPDYAEYRERVRRLIPLVYCSHPLPVLLRADVLGESCGNTSSPTNSRIDCPTQAFDTRGREARGGTTVH
jgi:protein-S-isoprenylcysteine O-methyltransferase Ste14